MNGKIVVAIVSMAFVATTSLSKAIDVGTEYEFTRVAEVGTQFRVILSQHPEMLENGKVLFQAEPHNEIEQVWVGDGTSVTSVSGPQIIGATLGRGQSNRSGEVAFQGRPLESPGSREVYHWVPGQEPNLIYSRRGSAATSFILDSHPSLNDVGQVAFTASGQGLPTALFVGDRDGTFPTLALASTGGPLFEGYTDFVSHPYLLNDGSIISHAVRGDIRGVYHFTAPGESTVVVEDGPLFRSIGAIDVNDHGDVAFLATSTRSGRQQVAVADASGFRFLLTATGTIQPIGVAINNSGDHLMHVTQIVPGRTEDLILSGPDPVDDRVLGVGDELLGGTVEALYVGEDGLNDHGQFAFWAQVTRPGRVGSITTTGIYIATPTNLIPEPSSLVLALAMMLGLLAWRTTSETNARTTEIA